MSKPPVAQRQADLHPHTSVGKGWASHTATCQERALQQALVGEAWTFGQLLFWFSSSSSFLSAGGTGACAGDGVVDVELGLVVVVGTLNTVKTSRIFSLSITDHSPQSLR